MYNPKKVWLLYAKTLYELLNRNRAEIQCWRDRIWRLSLSTLHCTSEQSRRNVY